MRSRAGNSQLVKDMRVFSNPRFLCTLLSGTPLSIWLCTCEWENNPQEVPILDLDRSCSSTTVHAPDPNLTYMNGKFALFSSFWKKKTRDRNRGCLLRKESRRKTCVHKETKGGRGCIVIQNDILHFYSEYSVFNSFIKALKKEARSQAQTKRKLHFTHTYIHTEV